MGIRTFAPCFVPGTLSVLATLVACGLTACGEVPPEQTTGVRLACTKAEEDGQVGGALSVVDQHGKPVQLKEGDVSVVVETRTGEGPWKPAETLEFGFNGPSQLDVVLVVDNSGSEIDDLERIREAARDFARRLEVRAHRDRVGLVRVSTQAEVMVPLTEDLAQFDSAVDALFVKNGWTALWDGLRAANDVLEQGALGPVNGAEGEMCLGRTYRAIVAFTDGRENNSADEHETRYPGDGIDTTLDLLAKRKVLGALTPLHLVGIGPKVDEDSLNRLADSTAGYYASIDDFASLHGKLMSAAARLDAQLPVCFTPKDCSDTEARITVTLPASPDAPQTLELALPSGWCATVDTDSKGQGKATVEDPDAGANEAQSTDAGTTSDSTDSTATGGSPGEAKGKPSK